MRRQRRACCLPSHPLELAGCQRCNAAATSAGSPSTLPIRGVCPSGVNAAVRRSAHSGAHPAMCSGVECAACSTIATPELCTRETLLGYAAGACNSNPSQCCMPCPSTACPAVHSPFKMLMVLLRVSIHPYRSPPCRCFSVDSWPTSTCRVQSRPIAISWPLPPLCPCLHPWHWPVPPRADGGSRWPQRGTFCSAGA